MLGYILYRSYYNWFVRKYAYPYFSTTTYVLCHCSSPHFYLSRCDPNRFKCLKSIFTKTNMITSVRYSLHSSFMLFMEFGSFKVIVDGSFSNFIVNLGNYFFFQRHYQGYKTENII